MNPTAELVSLARRELGGASASEEAGFARLEARRSRRSRGNPHVWWGVALAGALALGAWLWLALGDRAITFRTTGDAQATRIEFSDGSAATLGPGAKARVAQLTEHGARLELASGSMRVHVAKKPKAAWTVAAGPYDVRVTGTAFDVSWSQREQAFDLRMQSGAVIVTGPLAPGGIALQAGQHLFGGVAEGRLLVEGNEARPAESAALPAAPSPTPPPSARQAPGARTPEVASWSKQVAQGHFDAVLADAEKRGLERTLTGGSLPELSALADAARYAGRSALAERVLLAQRQRFAESQSARDAAFFLGRLAETSGGAALDWYERYLSESPRGPYAAQALGRKMMLLYRRRGSAAARPVASEYLSRFPSGPDAAAARKLEQEPRAPRP